MTLPIENRRGTIHEFVFSCAGTTRKIADAIATGLGGECVFGDLTSADFAGAVIDNADDIVLLATPVYGGRVPALAAERLSRVKGCGQRAVVAVVYGNRDYDDALLELCDIAAGQGFAIVTAAAFVAEHCIFPSVATGRPDTDDKACISRFTDASKEALDTDRRLDISTIKGKRPYKTSAGASLHPKTKADDCKQCQACVKACPTGAIDPVTIATDTERCITCCRCINVCKNGARQFGGIGYKTIKFAFEKMCAKRREPELFI